MKTKVPAFDGTASSYKKWKKLVSLWQTVCDEEDTKKQGVMLIMHMHSKASDIVIDETDTSVDKITAKLDTIFENDNDLMDIFDDFYKFRRTEGQTMKEYIHHFENKATKLKSGGLEIPDLILSYMILEAARLLENDKRIAKATCKDKTLKESKEVLLRLTDSQISPSSSASNLSSQIKVKEEQEVTFYGGHEEDEVLYNQDRRQDRRPFRDQRNRERQPCYGCGDRQHWIRDCPHVQKLRQQLQFNNSRSRGSNNQFRGPSSYNRGANNSYRERNYQNYICSELEEPQYDDQFFGKDDTQNEDNYNDDVERPIFYQSHVGNEVEEIMLVSETINKAVLDCGASRTVCGSEWFSIYLDSLPEKERGEIREKPSNTMFKFGAGMLRASRRVTIPMSLCDKKIDLEVDVVDTDIPLLLSLPTMKELGMSIDFKKDKVLIGDDEFLLETTSTGHYTLSLSTPKDTKYINHVMHEIFTAESGTGTAGASKKALKLHKRFAHASSARIIKLLNNADMADKEVFKELEKLDAKCDFCLRHRRAAPRPTVSLPLAYEFNELVTMDLKQIDGVWILHCCDYVTRFSSCHVLSSKDSQEVMNAMFKCWITLFGPMQKLLSDNGGEFINEHWKQMFATFNILHKDTASESPFQNGICERHNDLIGHMTMKVKEDVGCNLEVALMWAVHAKNSLISVLGFSPYQLVFGKNPNIPGNSNNKLPAMTSYTSSQTVANHLNSMRMSREAYIKAENADRVRRALRGRVFSGTHQRFLSGDVVYYKKNGHKGWLGPGKVLGQDGAQVLVKSGARTLIKLHPCKIILKETAERQINSKGGPEMNNDPNDAEKEEQAKKNQDVVWNEDSEDDDSEDEAELPAQPLQEKQTEQRQEENDNSVLVDELPANQVEEQPEDQTKQLPDNKVDDTLLEEQTGPRTRSKTNQAQIEKGDRIFIKETDESEWICCTIVESEGVLGMKWKVSNATGERFCIDLTKIKWLRAKEIVPQEADAVLFAEQIGAELALINFSKASSNEEEVAIAKEIEQWQKFDVYEEVDKRQFPNQEVINCRWVINEKVKAEGTVVKARLVIKGFQETSPPVADSPTASKSVTRIFIALANLYKYKFVGLDVRAAFLQSEPLDRLILVKPPKGYRTDDNTVWRLKKPVYGLKDGARAWFLTVKKELLDYGCTQLLLDNSVYVYHSGGVLAGFLVVHVDDFLAAGNVEFEEKVLKRLQAKFQIGTEKEGEFTYVGWTIKQNSHCTTVDQIEYQKSIKPITISAARKNQSDYALSDTEKKEYQQVLGKLQWITSQTRPDLRFRALECSVKAARPLVKDLLNLNTVVKKLQKRTVVIMYPSFSSDLSKLKIYAYADASLNNLPDSVSSARGFAIFLVSDQNAAILSWGSRKIKKVTKTIIYAEGLALSACLDDAMLLREIVTTALCLSRVSGETVPVIGLCDNKSLVENIYSSHQAEDVKLRIEVASLRQQMEHHEVKEIVWIPDSLQLADCLTKTSKMNHPVENLLKVIESGSLDFTPSISR